MIINLIHESIIHVHHLNVCGTVIIESKNKLIIINKNNIVKLAEHLAKYNAKLKDAVTCSHYQETHHGKV